MKIMSVKGDSENIIRMKYFRILCGYYRNYQKKLISKPTNEEFSQVLIINKNIKQNILESTTL